MFYAFKYDIGKPPKPFYQFDLPAGEVIEFENRQKRRDYVDNNKHTQIVSKRDAEWLKEANGD